MIEVVILDVMRRRCKTPVPLLLLVVLRCPLGSWLAFSDVGPNKGLSCTRQSFLQSRRSCGCLRKEFEVPGQSHPGGQWCCVPWTQSSIHLCSTISPVVITGTFPDLDRPGRIRSIKKKRQIVSIVWMGMTKC
jgi:hypothetical protein